ncbi:MAG TPA: hypothetical protein VLG71_03290, partial [Candidatus Limnocylindria bacterium]|nr:hypothetical protein [Candidatus Limnocylindria bacterium]
VEISKYDPGIAAIAISAGAAIFCRTPNGGDYLETGKEDSWPTHNDCLNDVTIIYPDKSTARTTASSSSNHNFRAYKNNQGEYHWEKYER